MKRTEDYPHIKHVSKGKRWSVIFCLWNFNNTLKGISERRIQLQPTPTPIQIFLCLLKGEVKTKKYSWNCLYMKYFFLKILEWNIITGIKGKL